MISLSVTYTFDEICNDYLGLEDHPEWLGTTKKGELTKVLQRKRELRRTQCVFGALSRLQAGTKKSWEAISMTCILEINMHRNAIAHGLPAQFAAKGKGAIHRGIEVEEPGCTSASTAAICIRDRIWLWVLAWGTRPWPGHASPRLQKIVVKMPDPRQHSGAHAAKGTIPSWSGDF